ncbi:MAG: AraC family transcriptional regulator [Cyclobacteriaceae bacterium]|nr:AraC family transcriptional regulator [Cyclobacteriaceae bacterium HetDA_MAG_MS6]
MELSADFLVSLFDVLGFVQGALIGLIFLFSSKKNKALPYLGIFLLAYSIELLLPVLEEQAPPEWQNILLFAPLRFYWLFMPAMYLYAKSITGNLTLPKEYIHFLPGALEFVIFLILFLMPVSIKLNWLDRDLVNVIDLIHLLISTLLVGGYCLATIRYIKRYRKELVQFHSSIQDKTLNWVLWIISYVLFTVISPLIIEIIDPADASFPLISILNVAFIFWVALSGFKQLYIPVGNTSVALEQPVKAKVYEHDFSILKEFMEVSMPYTNDQLNLKELAQQLGWPQRKLSEVINVQSGQNFNQFINSYRVEKAKLMLKDQTKKHLSILGIAYEAGFSSKSSFNTTFKAVTGYTPSAFKKAPVQTSESV